MRFPPSSLALLFATLVPDPSRAADEPAGAAAFPDWNEPEAYSVDLVIQADGQTFTMTRNIDHGRMRTRMKVDEQEFVMMELGDEQGTTITLMPAEKTAFKQSAAAMKGLVPADAGTAAAPSGPAEGQVELLGVEEIDGRVARKLRVSYPEGEGLAWFDEATGAPLRMEAEVEGKKSVMEWRNLQVGPQKAELFEVPKGWAVQDLDEMMQQMHAMGGAGMLGGLGGLGGMTGGAAGAFGGQMGSSFGSQLGSGVGGALGGPLGAMAGGYIGGKVGGFLGRKAAGAVTPGN